MSLACESIQPDNSDGDQQQQEQSNEQLDQKQNISRNSLNQKKDVDDDEELDFEEEVVPANVNEDENSRSFGDADDGELKDEENKDSVHASNAATGNNDKPKKDKDEGEIDSEDELEEGEVKEDDSDEEKQEAPKLDDSESKNLPRPRPNPLLESPRNVPRRDLLRPPERKSYYPNPYWQSNQIYPNRYPPGLRVDRHNNIIRPREPLIAAAPSSQEESAWEKGLKRARELISKASKRKEEEEDNENRKNLPSKPDRSPPVSEKRRRHSQDSSSEDEIERRHRLAYDVAPWNNPSYTTNPRHYQPHPSGNYRNNYRSNYTTNRSADTYRDPWRRSKSPKNVPISSSRSKELDVDARYDNMYGKEKSHSNSMSSLSSICSSSSHVSEKSVGRKLPYARPKLETGRINSNDDDLRLSLQDERENNSGSRSRFDRIPKKSNALSSPSMHFNRQNNSKQDSDHESFDSWSESLSDSSSYCTHSESDDDGDDVDEKQMKKSNRNESRGSQSIRNIAASAGISKEKGIKKSTRSGSAEVIAKDSKSSKHSNVGPSQHNQKIPIKMTFMKKQQSLKKDTVINEQLNGENISDLEDDDFCQVSNKSFNKSDEEDPISNDEEDDMDMDYGNQPSGIDQHSPKQEDRRRLLLQLKAVEEAIERKLNSKN